MFQFTRPQGARRRGVRQVSCSNSFNSRARKGRDSGLICGGNARDVSIHAPARGATGISNTWRNEYLFQFTRPQGARHRGTDFSTTRSCFNSRARKGRDEIHFVHHCQHFLFQFTRPQGARQSACCSTTAWSCFNSRARKGRDGAVVA